MKSLADRRTDIIITYLDGHGKSGEYIASLFAEENKITVKNIVASSEVADRLLAADKAGKRISAVLVVDDIAGTGNTLATSIEEFVGRDGDTFRKTGTKIFVCVLYATRVGVETILKKLRASDIEADLKTGETLNSSAFAFAEDSKIWSNRDERERAKALATDLGARVYRGQPLGFGGTGMLVVFPTTVPNNSLPILHSSSKGAAKRWLPLFLRPTN